MKNLLILGAGTAGTMMANHLVHKMNKNEWNITIVDQYKTHYYQPGFLFLPFDTYTEDQIRKDKKQFIPKSVNYIQKKIEKIIHAENKVVLEDETLNYDLLIVATGAKIAPEQVDGMKGANWHKNVFDFYTFEGALALRNYLRVFKGGKVVVHFTEMPIKCPVAPLEFVFLADSYFRKKGIRENIELTYVTPLGGAFTKPKATAALSYLLKEKNIKVVTDFAIESVDNDNNQILDYEGREVPYDLLVTVPTNMGDDLIKLSGMGDDLNFIPTNHFTLQSEIAKNIFVIGDASNVPASKAGSVAHFQAETLTDNILLYIDGKSLKEEFDGHANCFIETGNGKGLLIDFNYNQEPVEGKFPFPVVGPMSLLKETRLNHFGKMAFKWIYWNMLLKGIAIPFVTRNMSKLGKKFN